MINRDPVTGRFIKARRTQKKTQVKAVACSCKGKCTKAKATVKKAAPKAKKTTKKSKKA